MISDVVKAGLKSVLPNKIWPLRIVRGPFRGGIFCADPKASIRKVLGLYEHELNGWLATVLPQVSAVIDVGANDGYFTFGCAAALRRRGKLKAVLAFEPDKRCVQQLVAGRILGKYDEQTIIIVPRFVGSNADESTITLDTYASDLRLGRVLVKVDVEGAELDVITGAAKWLNADNFFVIEVHRRELIDAVVEKFFSAGLKLTRVSQRPLPILGPEKRDPENSWLVSKLEA